MKTKNLAKILVLALSLVLLMTAVIGITASAEGEDDRGNIYSTSIVHNDKISIAIAVKATAEEIANNTVTVKYQWADEAEPKTATYFGTHENQEGYVWVVTEGVAAYDLAREATITSYLNEGLVESGKYSVATFLYNKLYIDGVTGAAQECYETLLEYGATSQAYLDKNPGAPVNALNYAYTKNADVKINGSSSAFGSNVTLAYNGDQILEGWVVDGVTYPASQTTFEINGTCSVDVICTEKIKVNITIGEFANGTVTTDKDSYNVGDTVTLTITPASGYFQKLYINGEPLMLDWKTFTYSFTATENAYDITGSFENGLGLAPSEWGRWDDHNQAHGVLSTYYPNNNDSWWMAINGNYNSLTVKAQNQLPIGDTKDNFYVYLRLTMENGNSYIFRIGTDKGGYTAYNRAGIQNAGDATADWGGWKNLSYLDSAVCGDGVDFKVERTAANVLTLSVNGEIVDTYTMNGITAEDKIASISVKHQGNQGKYVDIPFVLTVPVEEEPPVYEGPVTLNIGEFANGTVTADKDSYNVGDNVTLTITPASGYFQKLYINGEPLMLGWKTFTYSFTATENAYEITGSFENGLDLAPSDAGRWDDHNQAHGVLNTYYPNNGDSWWMNINGEYQSVEITAKNLVPKADSMDGNGQNGYMQIIRFGLSNGKTYAFRIYNDKGTYAVSCTAVSGSSSGWGNWKNVANVLGYSIDDAMSGDGVQFKVERTSADTMTVSVNGVIMFTYTMDGVTEADTVTFVGIQSNANSGKYVEIPFELN